MYFRKPPYAIGDIGTFWENLSHTGVLYVLGGSRAPLPSRSIGDLRAVSETFVHSRRPSYCLGNLRKLSATLSETVRCSRHPGSCAFGKLSRRTSQSRNPPWAFRDPSTVSESLMHGRRPSYSLEPPTLSATLVNSWRPSYALIQRLSYAFSPWHLTLTQFWIFFFCVSL